MFSRNLTVLTKQCRGRQLIDNSCRKQEMSPPTRVFSLCKCWERSSLHVSAMMKRSVEFERCSYHRRVMDWWRNTISWLCCGTSLCIRSRPYYLISFSRWPRCIIALGLLVRRFLLVKASTPSRLRVIVCFKPFVAIKTKSIHFEFSLRFISGESGLLHIQQYIINWVCNIQTPFRRLKRLF